MSAELMELEALYLKGLHMVQGWPGKKAGYEARLLGVRQRLAELQSAGSC